MRKHFLAGLLAMAMAVSVTACSPGHTVNAGGDSEKRTGISKKKIGISMPTKSLEKWNREGSYFKKKFEKNGYDVEITYSDNDTSRQADDIRRLISRKADILVIAAVDGGSLSNVLESAKRRNIPVISYDRLIMNTDAVSYYVSFDNYKVGQLQGQYIIDKLELDSSNKKYNMEIIAGDQADNNSKIFYNGAMDKLKKYVYDGIINLNYSRLCRESG